MAGLRPRIKEITCIGAGALSEPPAAPVEIIGSAFEGHVYHSAAVVSKLRRKTIVLDFEFLNHLYGGLVIDVAGCAFTLLGGTNERAINTYLGRRVALSVRNEVGPRRIIVRGSRACSFGYTAGKKCQAEEIAPGKWNVFNVLIGHFCSQSRALGVKQRCGRIHFDGGSQGAWVHGEIERCLLIDRKYYTGFLLSAKPLGLSFNGICRRSQAGEVVFALVVGLVRSGNVCTDFRDRHSGTTNDSPAGVGDSPSHLGSVTSLAENRCDRRGKHACGQNHLRDFRCAHHNEPPFVAGL